MKNCSKTLIYIKRPSFKGNYSKCSFKVKFSLSISLFIKENSSFLRWKFIEKKQSFKNDENLYLLKWA